MMKMLKMQFGLVSGSSLNLTMANRSASMEQKLRNLPFSTNFTALTFQKSTVSALSAMSSHTALTYPISMTLNMVPTSEWVTGR